MKSVKRSNAQHDALSKRNFFKSSKTISDSEKQKYYAKAEYHDKVIRTQKEQKHIVTPIQKKLLFMNAMSRYGLKK